MGRPATPFMVEQISLRNARGTGVGDTRILSDVRQLGLERARSSEVKSPREGGLHTVPARGATTS